MKQNRRRVIAVFTAAAGLALSGPGRAEDRGDETVFDREAASFDVAAGETKYLKEGCKLYSDRELILKVRPKPLSSTRYILAPFDGCKVVCTKTGVALVLGLFDVHNQAHTERMKKYFAQDRWKQVKEIPEFAMFHSNGADRMGRVFWTEVKEEEKLELPGGAVLCYRYRN